MTPREKLIAKISAQVDPKTLAPMSGSHADFKNYVANYQPTPGPVVTLEDFFDGNTEDGSLGPNVVPYPGVAAFYATLKSIRSRNDVQDVLVEIYEIENDQSWPYSERVYVLTSQGPDKIREWAETIKPSEVTEGWAEGRPKAAPELKAGFKVYGLWWD